MNHAHVDFGRLQDLLIAMAVLLAAFLWIIIFRKSITAHLSTTLFEGLPALTAVRFSVIVWRFMVFQTAFGLTGILVILADEVLN